MYTHNTGILRTFQVLCNLYNVLSFLLLALMENVNVKMAESIKFASHEKKICDRICRMKLFQQQQQKRETKKSTINFEENLKKNTKIMNTL